MCNFDILRSFPVIAKETLQIPLGLLVLQTSTGDCNLVSAMGSINPIPTGLGHVTLIYGLILPMAGRNRVKPLDSSLIFEKKNVQFPFNCH